MGLDAGTTTGGVCGPRVTDVGTTTNGVYGPLGINARTETGGFRGLLGTDVGTTTVGSAVQLTKMQAQQWEESVRFQLEGNLM